MIHAYLVLVMTELCSCVGGRVMDKDKFKGSVMYEGPVEGTTGVWLGVDWDDVTRGKHHGQHKGNQYFHARSVTSGSFVRASKVTLGVDVMKAVNNRYGEYDLNELDTDSYIGSKQIEIVGIEKTLSKTKNVNKLQCVVLDSMNVSNCGDLQGQLRQCRELDLNNNLLCDWNEVIEILTHLHTLIAINLSMNKFRDLPKFEYKGSVVFPNIRALLVHHADLTWNQVCFIVSHFCGLLDLGLSHNLITHLNIESIQLQNVVSIDLEANPLNEWHNLKALFNLTKLQSLNLNSTAIREIHVEKGQFPSLQVLFMRKCLLHEWKGVVELSKLPSLNHVLLMDNPIMKAQNLATSKQIVIAIMPKLLLIDREEITLSERRGAEIDYLKRYGKEWLSIREDPLKLKQFFEVHPTYQSLIEHLGAPDAAELSKDNTSMKCQLVKVNITLSNGKVVVRPVLKSMTISKLKTLVARLDRRGDPRSFRLKFYRNKTPEICMEFDREFREIEFYSLEDGDAIHIDDPLE